MALVAMCCVSCSDDEDNSDEKVGTDLVGTWKVSKYFYEYKEHGKVVETKEYGEEKNETFILNKDGGSNFDCALDESCTWKYQGEKLYFHWSYEDGETDNMVYQVIEFSDDILIMEWKDSGEYERYELKKVDTITEEPNEPSDNNTTLPKDYQRVNLKFGEKHYIIGGGGGHYIKASAGVGGRKFFTGYDANEKQSSALTDIGTRAATYTPPYSEKTDYTSGKSYVRINIHHGYIHYLIYEDLHTATTFYFWVEGYLKEYGNIIGVSIIVPYGVAFH